MGVASDQSQQILENQTDENVEAFLDAARYNDMDDVMNLASMGVSLDSMDSQGRTALHMASANGNVAVVEYLIKNGVDINASNAEKNTPLHWACLNGHTEVARILILGGANPALLNSYQRTPVDEAVSNGKMEAVDVINSAIAQIELNGVRVS